jgi:hypothetical protein
VLNIRWFKPIGIERPSSRPTSTISSSASSVSCATVVLMLTRKRGVGLARGRLQCCAGPADPRSNVPFTPRALSCISPGPSIDDADCA